jgi:hypothetical protein
MKFIWTLALLCSMASAQSAPVVIGTFAAEGVDAYATYRNSIRPNYRESDPLARPFVTRGPVALGAYFAVDAGLKIGASYLLRKHGHRKIARIIEFAGIGDNIWGASTSFAGYHK